MKNIFLLCLLVLWGLSSCGTAKKSVSAPDTPDEISVKADPGIEIMPTFQGGNELAFRDWVQLRVTYPENIYNDYIARRVGEWALQGRVVAGFIIDTDGMVKDVGIRSSPHYSYDQIVKDIITGSPAWTPGYKNDTAVRVRYTLPVDFKIDQETLGYLRQRKSARRTGQRR